MSFTIILQHQIFRFPHLHLKNSIFNFTSPLVFSSSIHSRIYSSNDVENLYTSLLKKSTHRAHLNQIHNQLYTHGLQTNGFISTKFINVCSDLKEIDYARQVFDEFPRPYVFLWNAIIRGYYAHNMLDNVVEMYSRMQQSFVNPDAFTFPYILRACGELLAVGYGRAIHAQIFRHGFEEDPFIQNGLLSFYIKCEQNHRVRIIFDRLRCRNAMSWSLMISGYTQNQQPMEALRIFREMRLSNIKPDCITLVSVSKAYSDIEELNQGKCLHSLVIKMGHEFDPDLRVALTSLYAKCGQVMSAKSLFNQTSANDVMLWNSMISGFTKSGHANEALMLFNDIISRKTTTPNSVTIQSSVLACAQLGSLKQAKWMDNYVQNSNFKDNVNISTSLIDMYGKCGSVELARKVFDQIKEDKDVVTWSAMIMGYALHGRGRDALHIFNEMKKARVRPNDVTFLGLITACSHSGLVDEGWEIFASMSDYIVEPHQKHYASVVDLLGRGGYLEKAYDFIVGMPVEPGISVWGALLSACKMHRRVDLGEYAAERVFALDGQETGHYVQLSNLYASARLWDRVAKVRVAMKSRGLVKDLGLSMIEINGKLEGFRAGDESHPRWGEIYEKLTWLETRLIECGLARDAESGLHDLDGEEREMSLCNHSERVAIAYALISICDGTTLRIIKNLRACVNCHVATKMISKIVDREIVVRDSNRFHHFKDGICSCGDYWQNSTDVDVGIYMYC